MLSNIDIVSIGFSFSFIGIVSDSVLRRSISDMRYPTLPAASFELCEAGDPVEKSENEATRRDPLRSAEHLLKQFLQLCVYAFFQRKQFDAYRYPLH